MEPHFVFCNVKGIPTFYHFGICAWISMIFISILCTLLNSTSYYVLFFIFFFGFALYPSPPGLIYTLITLLSFSYSPLDVEKEGRFRAWSARFSSPPFLRLFFFLLLPSRRRKGGEVPRVVGALLLPSFSPVSLLLLILFPACFLALLQASISFSQANWVNSPYHRSQLRTSSKRAKHARNL